MPNVHNTVQEKMFYFCQFVFKVIIQCISLFFCRFTGIKLTHYGEISVNWNPCFDYSEPTGTACDGVAVSQ